MTYMSVQVPMNYDYEPACICPSPKCMDVNAPINFMHDFVCAYQLHTWLCMYPTPKYIFEYVPMNYIH